MKATFLGKKMTGKIEKKCKKEFSLKNVKIVNDKTNKVSPITHNVQDESKYSNLYKEFVFYFNRY